MSLDSIINVQISRETAAITQAGFGTALILGPNGFAGEVRSYTSITAVAEDFDTTDPEYKIAAKVFSQTPRVERVKIGRSDIAAQVATLTPVVVNDATYTVTFYADEDDQVGTTYSYTADSGTDATEIVNGLLLEINGEEVQLIEFATVPDEGGFDLHFGTDSVTVLYSDNAAAVQVKVRTLAGLEAAVVTGSYASGFTVIFRGYADDAPLLATSENTLETSNVSSAISVSVTAEGEERTHGIVATGTTTLVLTASEDGVAFLYDNSVNLTAVDSVPSASIADAINAAIAVDNDWYFLLTTSQTESVVDTAAETCEALRKIYVFRADASDIRTNSTTDLLSDLVLAGYYRTACFYTGTASDYGDGGFVGRLAPYDPGSETWAFKTLSGVTVDAWTDSEQGYLVTKNANYYLRIGGVNTTLNGKVVGGEFIDVIRFSDWLVARIQERIFGDLVRNTKIPYTDAGIAIIEAGIRAVLEAGVAAGGIASSQDYTVTVPVASAVSSNDKAQRVLRDVSFTARLAGAIHAVEIQGNVTL